MVRSQKQDSSIFVFQNVFHMYSEKIILCSLVLIIFYCSMTFFLSLIEGLMSCLPFTLCVISCPFRSYTTLKYLKVQFPAFYSFPVAILLIGQVYLYCLILTHMSFLPSLAIIAFSTNTLFLLKSEYNLESFFF